MNVRCKSMIILSYSLFRYYVIRNEMLNLSTHSVLFHFHPVPLFLCLTQFWCKELINRKWIKESLNSITYNCIFSYTKNYTQNKNRMGIGIIHRRLIPGKLLHEIDLKSKLDIIHFLLFYAYALSWIYKYRYLYLGIAKVHVYDIFTLHQLVVGCVLIEYLVFRAWFCFISLIGLELPVSNCESGQICS